MSPEIKVFVPDDEMDRVLRSLAEIPGAEIKAISYGQESNNIDLQAEFDNLRGLVSELTTPKSPKVENGIRRGYEALFEKTFQIKLPDRQRRVICHLTSDEELHYAQVVMAEIFLDCTTKPPHRVVGNDPKKVFWKDGTLNPRYVDTVVRSFGLIDGRVKSSKELAMEMNTTRDAAYQFQSYALKFLRHPLNEEKLRQAGVIEFQDSAYF